MLIVEFFGPSGSGKSYLRKKMISKYFKNYKVYDYKSINLNLKKQNFLVKIYFNLIKSSFVLKIKKIFKIENLQISFLSFFFKNYNKTIKQNTFRNKNVKQLIIIEDLIKKSSFDYREKMNFSRWAKEEIIGNEHARNNKNIKSILIDSEGLIQRLFVYCYKKKNKKELIKRYLNNINLPNVLIHFRNIRIKKKTAKNIDKNEIIMIYLLTLNFLKQKKILLLNSEQGVDNLQKNIYKKLKEYKK